MEFRVNKHNKSRDPVLNTIRSEISRTALKVACRKTQGISANGDGSDALVNMGFLCAVSRWRIVGIGGYVYVGGLSTKAESMVWGHLVSDLGATDEDAFGSLVCTTTGGDELEAGDFIFQCIDEFKGVLDFDALANAGAHTWDISGTGAGVLMGDWQSKATFLTATKKNVADSDATISPFFFIEYDLGEGVI